MILRNSLLQADVAEQGTLTIARTSYNLPSAITNGSISTQFFYAPDRSYWKQVAVYTGGTETSLYLGGLLEKVTRANGTTDWRHRIATPGAGSILYIRQSTGTNLTYSVAGDHLGSTSVVTDSAQALIVSQSFGAFGARRGSNWQGTPSSGDLTQIEATSRRGFTDHTMVDNLSLIHMNGRMYDPVIGRFLSADPYPLVGRVALADPAGVTTDVTQAFNRYSYVDNNPLSYTDPSGFQSADGSPSLPCSFCAPRFPTFPRNEIGTSGACDLMEYCTRGPGFTYLSSTPFDGYIARLAFKYASDLEVCKTGDAMASCTSGVFGAHIREFMPDSMWNFIMAQVPASAGMSIAPTNRPRFPGLYVQGNTLTGDVPVACRNSGGANGDCGEAIRQMATINHRGDNGYSISLNIRPATDVERWLAKLGVRTIIDVEFRPGAGDGEAGASGSNGYIRLHEIRPTNTAAHELGHALGFGHNSSNPESLMFGETYFEQPDQRAGYPLDEEIRALVDYYR